MWWVCVYYVVMEQTGEERKNEKKNRSIEIYTHKQITQQKQTKL